jgi:DNA-binding MarR family transcriptional regulator
MEAQRRQRDDVQVVFKLRDFGTAFEALRNAAAPHVGLNRTDLRALDLIVRTRGLTAGELSRRLEVTTGAITAVLDRLEKSGHAMRRDDEHDRRRVVIWPTEKAEREGNAIFARLRLDMLEILRTYSDHDVEVIVDFMAASAAAMFDQAADLRGQR